MSRKSRGREPKIRVYNKPVQDLVEYVPHSDDVASIVVYQTTEQLDIATQVAMPQQDCVTAVQVFDAFADLDAKFPFDCLLAAGQSYPSGEEAEVAMDLRQGEPRERLR